MTQSVPDRMRQSLERINGTLNPDQVFALQWEYSVISASPGPPVTIDCEAIDKETTAHLPPQLVGLVLWPGPSGFVAQPSPQSIVRVGFVNGDPSKPYVAGLDPNDTPLLVMGFADLIQLGDPSATPITPSTWAQALAVALTTFATGLNSTTVAANGAALLTALGLLPPAATTVVLAK